MDKYYNLNGYLIFESQEGRGWVDWVENELGELICRVGQVKIDRDIDVTILSNWENKFGETKFKRMAQASEYVESQPPWDQTRYYTRLFETGSSGLLECSSGEVVDPDFEYEAHPQLVIKHNNMATTQPCAVCGGTAETKAPLALFLFEVSSPFPLRPVCRKCGTKYGPHLVKLLDYFYRNKNEAPL
jgi:hypothetical protein